MLHLETHLRYREHLKMYKKLKKKLMVHDEVDGSLVRAIESTPAGTLKLQLRMHLIIYIETQEGVLEVALKGAFEVPLELRLYCTC